MQKNSSDVSGASSAATADAPPGRWLAAAACCLAGPSAHARYRQHVLSSRPVTVMGAALGYVVGRVAEETPAHVVLPGAAATSYEVRRYAPSVVAETSYATETMGKNAGEAFGRLARYIGVFSDAQNRPGEKIAMTAPVLMGPQIGGGGGGGESEPQDCQGGSEGTVDGAKSPLLAGSLLADGRGKMAFLLPGMYQSVEAAPPPTNPAVLLRQLPERTQVGRGGQI
eukprot:COSAG01_NODE_1495_length_10123_cov_6.359537_9_plen_226_part_00